MPDDKFHGLSQFKYINMETYRRDGTGVRTPVWFILHDSLIYLRTDEKSGKVKRIKNNSHVKVAPCDIRGKIKGKWIQSEAKFEDSNEIFSDIEKKYGVMSKIISIMNKIKGIKPVVISIKAE